MIYGLGTDIIEISRIKNAARRDSFLRRVYTEKEIALCRDKQDFFASLAVRFAAKEAVAKAFGTGFRGFRWQEIEILADSLDKPLVILHGKAWEIAKELGIAKLEVTMSHSKDYGVAFCVAEGSEQDVSGHRGRDETY
ncbi:MAG: holo-ACP synthase [Bacillota bacterium]|jgi:holo-[acyl-carrier protein] synthase|nr:holo-ACP synthase [Clostridia bacterium]